jgi:predicted transcriptional regulator
MPAMMTSRDLLRQRTALSLTRADLSRSSGVSEALIARVEGDDRQATERPISMKRLEQALADAGLGRRVDEPRRLRLL